LQYGPLPFDRWTVTGLQGRNGIGTVEIPIIDGCPAEGFLTDEFTGNFVGSAVVSSDWSGWYAVTQTNPFFATRSREERWRITASVQAGKLFFFQEFAFRNQVGVLDTYGDPDSPSSTRDPSITVDRDALRLCNEIDSGFELTYPHIDIGGGSVTVVGYMEIGLT
jgi:hypothetical protein